MTHPRNPQRESAAAELGLTEQGAPTSHGWLLGAEEAVHPEDALPAELLEPAAGREAAEGH